MANPETPVTPQSNSFFSLLLSPLYGTPTRPQPTSFPPAVESTTTAATTTALVARKDASTDVNGLEQWSRPSAQHHPPPPPPFHHRLNMRGILSYPGAPNGSSRGAVGVAPPSAVEPGAADHGGLHRYRNDSSSSSLYKNHGGGGDLNGASAPLRQTSEVVDGSNDNSSNQANGAGLLGRWSRFAYSSPAARAEQAWTDSTTTTTTPALPSLPQQQQQQQQSVSSACASHMLGYRQCLEMNPDSKLNCTYALDNYMKCQEDFQT